MYKKSGTLFVISGPSGVGKSTLCSKVLEVTDNIVYSISCTTRPSRQGEVNGKEYFFVSETEFEQKVRKSDFIEWARVHEHYYGTPKKFIIDTIKSGTDVILDIDVQGGMAISRNFSNSVLIFVLPPSLSTLRKRLKARKQDSENIIRKRVNKAKWEFKFVRKYGYAVENDELEDAVKEIGSIISAERLKVQRQVEIIKKLIGK
ncbi:MAG: guanylate kinase [Elusimicrobiota bacterium]